MSPHPHILRPASRRGFTLMELLTVLAIISILAGILVPTINQVKQRAAISRTVLLYQKVAQAMEGFKAEYGFYPVNFPELQATALASSPNNPNEKDVGFHLNDGSNVLRQVLTADQDTSVPANVRAYNRKAIPFLALDDNMLSPDYPATPQNKKIIDGFGNDDINVIVHIGTSKSINKESISAMAGVTSMESPSPLKPVVMHDLQQSIAIYSLMSNIDDDNTQSTFITNWEYNDFNQ